jgi:hypothetical protein
MGRISGSTGSASSLSLKTKSAEAAGPIGFLKRDLAQMVCAGVIEMVLFIFLRF